MVYKILKIKALNRMEGFIETGRGEENRKAFSSGIASRWDYEKRRRKNCEIAV